MNESKSTSISFKSCHHGDANHPNNLEYAKIVIEENTSTIDIIEIDFITFNHSIISSHDYDIESIENSGNPLKEWIDFVIYRKRRFLWIDVKQNTWPLTSSSYFSGIKEQFDPKLLFKELNKIRQSYLLSSLPYYHHDEANIVNIDDYHESHISRMKGLRNKDITHQTQLDIMDYILIGCQDRDLAREFSELNEEEGIRVGKGKWQLIVDIPYVENYVYQYMACIPRLIESFNDDKIRDDFVYNRLNYDGIDWIAIDHAFFTTSDRLVYFIRLLKDIYPPGRNIIIYNIDRYIYQLTKSFKPIIELYTVIFQYDFESKKKEGFSKDMFVNK